MTGLDGERRGRIGSLEPAQLTTLLAEVAELCAGVVRAVEGWARTRG